MVKLFETFKFLQYFDEPHIYINSLTGERLPSVTGHIKQFQPTFQEDYWLGIKASERGITKEELKEEWQLKSKQAQEQGSCLHAFLEQKIQRRHIVPTLPDHIDRDKFDILLRQGEDYIKNIEYPMVAVEFVMCNLDNTLAGMCDLLLQGKEGLRIVDYKTGQMKDSYGKTHKSPYKDVPASSIGKYSLQLNHYRDFLESRGFAVESMEIVWFNENNPTFEVFEIDKIEII